jgi:hypothetical protein
VHIEKVILKKGRIKEREEVSGFNTSVKIIDFAYRTNIENA